MDTRALIRWGDLEEERRRRARRGLGRLPAWGWSLAAAIALALLVARGFGKLGALGEATPLGASNLLLAAIATSHVIVLFTAPFRMYWRRDSALLGRLAVPGEALFRLALWRSLRAALRVSLPCLVGALGFGVWGDWEIAARHAALVGVAFCLAGLLGPAVALAAGAVVASDRAQALISSMGGEVSAPKTSWLGMLPGLAATALVLLVIAGRAWAQGAEVTAVGPAAPWLGGASAAAIAASLWALRAPGRIMLDAVREVSALDAERLAHVERTMPSPLERAWGRLLRAPGARLVHAKDVSLARRRYPIPFFTGMCGALALLIVAIARPEDLLSWSGVLAGCVGAYGVVMARRMVIPPIEQPTLLRSLPVGAVAPAAKRLWLVSWTVTYVGVAGVAVVLRAPRPVITAVVLGAIAVGTIVAGWLAGQEG